MEVFVVYEDEILEILLTPIQSVPLFIDLDPSLRNMIILGVFMVGIVDQGRV